MTLIINTYIHRWVFFDRAIAILCFCAIASNYSRFQVNEVRV
ncbi:hypothetical protein OGM63_20210 [Plectonema radiosum NIES-515]|uniref:Uncharacterized protein n=1 Tax=Plectonema radiosum NIES-515 TaxID=2986073 RepID=A0ABT3B362_9CYAN|nr:hypothetical protein [Plectonema radiosum]MCV3215804.1 hypothetical protein [Plectonema radiosum NIES-515]